jgi:starch-binding outer membrane protein, SusD/RagB family
MRTRNFIAPVALTLALSACGVDFNIPNPNGPSIDGLVNAPTPVTVGLAAQGLFIGLRSTAGTYAQTAGIFGREAFNLDPSEVRNVLGYLVGPLEPGGFGVDLGWTNEYKNIRLGNTILHSVAALSSTVMTDAQKNSILGLTKTIMAADLLNVIRVRDDIGAVIDTDGDPLTSLPDIVTKDKVYARIIAQLDSAQTLLLAGGTAFPFVIPSGFASFNTPATFIKFNRAVRARTDIYMARMVPAAAPDVSKYTAALTDLNASFISSVPGNFQTGAYHTFSSASGDITNPEFDSNAIPRVLVAHPSILTQFQNRADGTPDLRFQKKIATFSPAKILQNEASTAKFTIYNTLTDPMPFIKDEDLVLMRAEAEWFTGAKQAAVDDINLVRINSGGLAPKALSDFPDDNTFINELLYNRRFSLLLEYGHRWVDSRRFNRLAQLPIDVPGRDQVFPYEPLNSDECTARAASPPSGCRQVNGVAH